MELTTDGAQRITRRVQITSKRDPMYGETGVIVSGPTELKLFRVKMDQPYVNGDEHRYLFTNEFELLPNLESKSQSDSQPLQSLGARDSVDGQTALGDGTGEA